MWIPIATLQKQRCSKENCYLWRIVKHLASRWRGHFERSSYNNYIPKSAQAARISQEGPGWTQDNLKLYFHVLSIDFFAFTEGLWDFQPWTMEPRFQHVSNGAPGSNLWPSSGSTLLQVESVPVWPKRSSKPLEICNWLVVSTPLKNMKVSWDDYSQYMGKTCSKPPTS